MDPDNHIATDYLRQMYEKRRDWEKLPHAPAPRGHRDRLGEAGLLARPRIPRDREARDRAKAVKKPEVCIELWQRRSCRATRPTPRPSPRCRSALLSARRHFRGPDGRARAAGRGDLRRAGAKIQVLTKLGTIYGDRLNNDEGAVTAWRTLLTLDPNDRKAQEALKKKYLALGMWDELELFYAEAGKWDELIRVLEQQEAKETRPDAKIGLLFKIAQLWADKKQKSDRAAKAYEKVLEIEPGNLAAAEALIPIYGAANNAKALANAIEVKLSHEQDPTTKLELYRDVAALYEGKVKEPQKAFDRFLAAVELAPADERTSVDVERAAKTTGGWDKVIESYQRAIAQSDRDGDRALGVTLRIKLGRVLVDEVNDVPGALEAYRAVYEVEDDNPEAPAAHERLYRQTSRFSDLLDVYGKRRDLSTDPADKKAINYEIAKLYETEIKNVDRAIDTYNSILEDEPSDGRSLAALDVLYAELGRWEPFVDTLRRRIELDVSEAELIELKFRLGQTLEMHLSDPAGALENYREILFLSSQHEGARLGPREAAPERRSARGEAAAILENIYEERADYPKAHRGARDPERVRERRPEARPAQAQDRSHQLGGHGRLLGARSPPRGGVEGETLAGGDAQRDREGRRRVGRLEALVALFNEIAASLSDAALARDYWMRVATIDEQLGKIDEAAESYNHVLTLDASDAEALAGLEQLFTRTQRWTELIGVKERRIEQANVPEEREALYFTMAQIYDEKLGQPESAVASYTKVLELDPANLRALGALARSLFTRQRMWAELAENLEAQLALTIVEADQLALVLRLASLREKEMGQIDAAIEGYRQILERDMTHAEALGALERLGKDPKHELAIADLLEPLYRHLGDHAKLIGDARGAGPLQRELGAQDRAPPSDRPAVRGRGRRPQRLVRDDGARAQGRPRQRSESGGGLDRVARATGRFEDLAQVFVGLAKEIKDHTLASRARSTPWPRGSTSRICRTSTPRSASTSACSRTTRRT